MQDTIFFFIILRSSPRCSNLRKQLSTRTENVNQVFNLILIEFQWNFISDVCVSECGSRNGYYDFDSIHLIHIYIFDFVFIDAHTKWPT